MAFMQKKEPPFKKQKVGPSSVPVGAPPKSAFKSTFSMPSKTAAKGRSSSSPLASPPDQSGASTSPSGAASNSKKNVGLGDTVEAELMKRDSIDTCERNPSKVARAVEERPRSSNFSDRSMDLQSMLISLLKENPKGMSLKALEKAVGDTIPISGKKIDPIMKKIATFQAPGRYLLKPGVDVDSFKGPSPGNGSSPEDNYNQRSAAEEDLDQTSVPGPTLIEKVQPGQGLAGSNSAVEDGLIDSETVDIEQTSPDIFGDKKNSDHSEGRAGSSSDSGSDSDSESGSSDSRSESGSPSGSRSRSRSPVGSGSGSSSDSESDASSNSKEGSDEDVDIMTSDDDKEPKHNFQVSEPVLSSLPHEDRAVQDEFGDKQEEHKSNVLHRQKDLPNVGQDIETHVNSEREGLMGDVNHFPPNQKELLERQNFIGSLFDERGEMSGDSFRREQSECSDRIAHGSRRGYNLQHSDVKRDRVKRSKVEGLAQPSSPGVHFPQHMSPPILSPGRPTDDPFKSPVPFDGTDRDVMANPGFQKAPSQTFPRKSTLQQTVRRSSDQGLRGSTHNTPRKPNKRSESLDHDQRFLDKNSTVQEGLAPQKDKSGKDAYSEGFTPEKLSKGMKDGLSGGKHSLSAGSLHGETIGKPKDIRQNLKLHTGPLPKDHGRSFSSRSSPVNVRGAMLQRELSDLELGELREPVPDEEPVKKQFEREDSFKQPETKSTNSDSWKTDLGRGKPPGMSSAESGKLSPSNSSARMSKSSEGFSRKRSRDDELATSVPQGSQSQLQQPSRIDHAEIAAPLSKTLDASQSRKNDTGESQGTVFEEFGKSQKVASANGSQQPDKKRGQVSHFLRESKIQASNTVGSMMNGQKDIISFHNGGQKRRESSSDESSCSYSKYEKDEPEFKGPIKDYAQYKEYVQEFCDKYDSYHSLNKILENYRSEFEKMGKDLEFARGRDIERYNNILTQLKESYRKCGARHKRLKKIFIVLHEELKHLKEMIKDFASLYPKE
ncbi:Occludin_ELL domain-containing protein [Psidium guajava]|nr:Occludin_ELL domain-containing protein [Psidium guajava]